MRQTPDPRLTPDRGRVGPRIAHVNGSRLRGSARVAQEWRMGYTQYLQLSLASVHASVRYTVRPTEASSTRFTRVGRSDRSRIGRQVEGHGGSNPIAPVTFKTYSSARTELIHRVGVDKESRLGFCDPSYRMLRIIPPRQSVSEHASQITLPPERIPMARSRVRRFEVESLERKQLLSTMLVTHHAAARHPALVLNGNLENPASNVLFSGDTYNNEEHFAGRVKGMGAVYGTLILDYAPDTTTPQLTSVKLVLSNAKGSVTLGDGQNAIISTTGLVTEFITKYRFNVQSGTGAYSGVSGAGTFIVNDDQSVTADWGFPHPVYLTLHTTRSR